MFTFVPKYQNFKGIKKLIFLNITDFIDFWMSIIVAGGNPWIQFHKTDDWARQEAGHEAWHRSGFAKLIIVKINDLFVKCIM